MPFLEYLKKEGMTFRAFSKIVDIDQTQLSRYAHGRKKPSLENAYKIYLASKKKIKLEDWFNVKD